MIEMEGTTRQCIDMEDNPSVDDLLAWTERVDGGKLAEDAAAEMPRLLEEGRLWQAKCDALVAQ